MIVSAIRSTWRPPTAKASSTPATGTTTDSTSRKPPGVTASRVVSWGDIKCRRDQCPHPPTRQRAA